MTESEKLITDFVLESLRDRPVSDRIKYYRALARITSSTAAVASLEKLATDLEAIEHRHRQLTLDLTA